MLISLNYINKTGPQKYSPGWEPSAGLVQEASYIFYGINIKNPKIHRVNAPAKVYAFPKVNGCIEYEQDSLYIVDYSMVTTTGSKRLLVSVLIQFKSATES